MTRRGMREAMALQGIRRQGIPPRREQAVSELARLEHERARLRRELDQWRAREQHTASRLQQVEDRMARLQDALATSADLRPVEQPSVTQRPQKSRVYHELPLEY
jgi:chromosome segregation ATPase